MIYSKLVISLLLLSFLSAAEGIDKVARAAAVTTIVVNLLEIKTTIQKARAAGRGTKKVAKKVIQKVIKK